MHRAVPSVLRKPLSLLAIVLLLGATMLAPGAAVALDFANGATNTLDSDIRPANARVFDGPGDATTTLDVVTGGAANGVIAFGGSVVNIFAGAISDGAVNGEDTSSVSIFGGTIAGADAEDASTLLISGGSFTRGSGRVVGAFGDANVTITGGSFSGTDISVLARGDSGVEVRGGSFSGSVRAEDDSTAVVRGGAIPDLVSRDRAALTLIGSAFAIPALGGPISLNSPFVIDSFLDDVITGTLADGSALNAGIFNAGTGALPSRIILQAVPVPAALPLLAGALAALFGIARRRA